MTNHEAEQLSKSLKNEEFRKLLFDYMEEISDPKNRALYEQELAQLEAEKGVKLRFVNPCAEFEATFDKKHHLNICSSPEIAQPESKAMAGGVSWSLPYSLSQPRQEASLTVIDCVFHPDTIAKCSETRFKQMVIDTAIDGIAQRFQIKLGNPKISKAKSKAKLPSTVIREAAPHLAKNDSSQDFIRDIVSKQSKQHSQPKLTKPKYEIIHQDLINDLGKFTSQRNKHFGARPDSVLVKVHLDKLTSAKLVDLNVTTEAISISVKNHYEDLVFSLPFPVDSENGSAKFDKDKRILNISLPVIQPSFSPAAESASNDLELRGTRDDFQAANPSLAAVQEPQITLDADYVEDYKAAESRLIEDILEPQTIQRIEKHIEQVKSMEPITGLISIDKSADHVVDDKTRSASTTAEPLGQEIAEGLQADNQLNEMNIIKEMDAEPLVKEIAEVNNHARECEVIKELAVSEPLVNEIAEINNHTSECKVIRETPKLELAVSEPLVEEIGNNRAIECKESAPTERENSKISFSNSLLFDI